ncbi:MAG: PorV/PorQ family protein [candidate division KSB1 bacterium]|nr:PorV/PorQ family protein [candidate division KSB1 bacterium]
MKKNFLIVALLFLVSIIPEMVLKADSPGTVGFEFLRTQVGARPSAMGGAFVAVSGDLNSIYYNPAGIADIKSPTGSFTYLKHLLDFHSGFMGGILPQWWGNLGLGIHYMNFGSFTKTTSTEPEGTGETFGAYSFSISLAYGSKFFKHLSYGWSLKYIRSSIDTYTSDAMAIDLGAIFHVPWMKDLNIGAGITNLGKTRTPFINTKEDLPRNLKAGFSKRLEHLPLLLSFEFYKYVDDIWQWALGGEFTLREGLFFRLGYNAVGRDSKVEAAGDKLAGLNLGLGFIWQTYHLDYSFSSFGEVGSLNRVTFSASF